MFLMFLEVVVFSHNNVILRDFWPITALKLY
jgi:hypothetical protein